MTTRLPLCALALVLPALALAQGGHPPRVAVVPFAALSGDVPQRAGTRAAGLLSTELRNAGGFELIDAGRAAPADPFRDALEEARRLVEAAAALRGARNFAAAEASLEKALGAYVRGAPGLADVGELQDAYVLLSAIQYSTGRDEEGARNLDLALALAPARQPPLAATSRLFLRVVNAARKTMLEGPKGSLVVESSPPGAAVLVDGVAMGGTPLKVSDVPPGPHLWAVHLPSGEVVGGVVQVPPKAIARVSGQAAGSDPEAKMLATLSRNRIDRALVETAGAHARALQAEMLIFGALSREGRSLALDSFVLKVATGEVKRLSRSNFDVELLSAGMEFYKLAGRLAKEGLAAGSDARVPGPVSAQWNGGPLEIAEVRYGGAGDGPDVPAAAAPPRRPLEKKRSPLKPRAP
jgi:hypothetical protein